MRSYPAAGPGHSRGGAGGFPADDGSMFESMGSGRSARWSGLLAGQGASGFRSLLKKRARQRSRSPWWLDERLRERLRRGFGGGIPCGRRALFQKASLRRSRRSRPSPLLRLALWKNSSPRYQSGFFNRLLRNLSIRQPRPLAQAGMTPGRWSSGGMEVQTFRERSGNAGR